MMVLDLHDPALTVIINGRKLIRGMRKFWGSRIERALLKIYAGSYRSLGDLLLH